MVDLIGFVVSAGNGGGHQAVAEFAIWTGGLDIPHSEIKEGERKQRISEG
jgi:hypothetical protein